MRAASHYCRLRFQHPSHAEQCRAPAWVSHPLGDVRQNPARTLHTVDAGQRQARGLDLAGQLLGTMKIGGRELLQPARGISVLPIPQVLLHDRRELRVIQDIAGQPVQRRSEA